MIDCIIKNIEIITGLTTIGVLLIMIITLIVNINIFKKHNKINNIKNHLELKKMFNEENRYLVNQKLRPNGERTGGKGPESNKDRLMIEDYLGLFEICEEMLNDKVLKDKLFKSSYLYKLENVINNDFIMKEKINNKNENRQLLKDLIKRYNLQ